MAVQCGRCGSSELELVEKLEDGRRRLRCTSCGNQWLRGEAKKIYKKTSTTEDLRRRFPSPDDVAAPVRQRANELKDAYLSQHPRADPRSAAFRLKYRDLFQKENLPTASPDDLKYFANANVAGNPGNMSVFNKEWNKLDPDEAASRVRESIDYLLYGPEKDFIEDRLTNLISGHHGLGFVGFREALLTKVLCMVEPDRFLPITSYTGNAGKREIAEWVYDLDLPHPEAVSWTIGRLVFWSNGLLLELVGGGFEDTEHAAGFLWWAKDQVRPGDAASAAGSDDAADVR